MNLKQPSLGLVFVTAIACNAPNEVAQPQAAAPSGGIASSETASSTAPTTPSGSSQAAPAATTPPSGVTPKAGPAGPAGAAGADAKANNAVAGAGSIAPMGPPAAAADGVPGLAIAPNCQGINFKDIRYSPGGDSLPNRCEPFDGTLNNPYAVRCVDAWPWYKTKYPGDAFCILPPPPDKGLQYGYHPQGDADAWFKQVSAGDLSAYENLANTPWELAPGQETDQNYVGGTDNPEAHNFYRAYVRMRSGSHHLIVSTGGGRRGQWGPGVAVGVVGGDIALPSVQRTDENWPASLAKPAEDAGLYRTYPARANVTFNVHNFNPLDRPVLRESWTNIWWEEDAKVKMQFISAIPTSQFTLLEMAPGTTRDLHYAWEFSQEVRVIEFWGHRHSWTPTFSAWVERSGGNTELLYLSLDWYDVPTYRYDSMTMNPVPQPERRVGGASSGVLTMKPGDRLHYNCHITFTDERAAKVGGPSATKVGTLGFANEAYNAEMCIMFGWTAGVTLGRPADVSGPLPSFATIE